MSTPAREPHQRIGWRHLHAGLNSIWAIARLSRIVLIAATRRESDEVSKTTLVKAVIAQVLLWSSALVVVSAYAQEPRWVPTNQQADWPGQDYACSVGTIPDPGQCNHARIGHVAVCWLNRGEGYPFPNCRGARAWCTYKHVSVFAPAVGASPGQVWVCGR
jgi:hypothetical protein